MKHEKYFDILSYLLRKRWKISFSSFSSFLVVSSSVVFVILWDELFWLNWKCRRHDDETCLYKVQTIIKMFLWNFPRISHFFLIEFQIWKKLNFFLSLSTFNACMKCATCNVFKSRKILIKIHEIVNTRHNYDKFFPFFSSSFINISYRL